MNGNAIATTDADHIAPASPSTVLPGTQVWTGNLNGAIYPDGTPYVGTAPGYSGTGNTATFTAGAAGNVDNDPDLDTWEMNMNKVLIYTA